MAYCYNPSKPGVHPPIQQAECNLGLVRRSVNLVGVCVDGGMYLGARAYLEISDVDGHFRSYQRMGEAGKTDWAVHDFTAEVCSSDS